MHFRANVKKEFEIFSNSFSDIMFFLMLFFLITSTMITPGIVKLNLPNARNSQSMNKTPTEVAISITRDLKYYIDNRQVRFLEIEAELIKMKNNIGDIILVVRCDNSIAVQSLVDVLQIGSKIGVKVVLATARKEQVS